jgi:hypothetical protein
VVERIYKKDEWVEERGIPQAKKCSFCKGPLNKGVEILVIGVISGYKGTFCCNECRVAGCSGEDSDKG